MTVKAKVNAQTPLIFHVYAFLFCLSIIAINPFALLRGAIWTQPKVVCIACITALHLFILYRNKNSIKLTDKWQKQAIAWSIFLFFGLISTSLSLFPGRSFFGHSVTADGWLYWFLLAGFTLTNSLFLKQYPHLFHWQLRGVLVGIALVALSIYPQLLNWKIDYTVYSGELWPGTEHVLATSIYKNHQPIGLYSHRGFAAFPLAMASVLSLVSIKNQWLPSSLGLVLTVLFSVTLNLTQTRGALLAMLTGWFWLALVTFQRKLVKGILISLALISVLSFITISTERRLNNAEYHHHYNRIEIAIKNFTSDRIYFWKRAWKGISERPWIGWGFGGYSIANATHLCPTQSKLVALEDYRVYCKLTSNNIVEVKTTANTAHNFILDIQISLGAIGTINYFALLGCYVMTLIRHKSTRVALFITYLTYLLTWYDSGQFSHIGWWVLSIYTEKD